MIPSFSSAGKKIRMDRIFKKDGNAVIVAINHGVALGPVPGIDDMSTLMKNLITEEPDGFIMHRGMANSMVDIFSARIPLILKATNKTPYLKSVEEAYLASVQDALVLGADAMSVGLSLADEREWYTIAYIAKLVSEAMGFGMPIMAHAYPNGKLISDEKRYDVENVGRAVRVARELGIDVIKTYWTGSQKSFEKIVNLGSPAKVVISGGPRCATLRQCFDMTWKGMQAGAHGIAYGRNIWQHPYPSAVLKGLISIIHNKANVDEAMNIASDAAKTALE